MNERESKKNIDKEEYKRLTEWIKWEKRYKQINYYYDTEQFDLALRGITIRARDKEDRLVLQVKYPDLNNNIMIREREEREFPLESLEDMIPENILINNNIILKNLKTSIRLRGIMVTYRRECGIGNGAILFLDKNVYLDKIDYEIELEYGENTTSVIYKFLEQVGIEFTDISIGKNARYINRLKELHDKPLTINKNIFLE